MALVRISLTFSKVMRAIAFASGFATSNSEPFSARFVSSEPISRSHLDIGLGKVAKGTMTEAQLACTGKG